MEPQEIARLPQARLYLRAAEWGIKELVSRQLMGHGFRFYLVGILASLRAVQHALRNHDRHITHEHRRLIDEWWERTRRDAGPELKFIRASRDRILKGGSFEAYAARSVSACDYDLSYYVGGERHELLPELQAAVAWCDRELSPIEAQLPPLEAPL